MHRIILVEDDAGIGDVLRRILSRAGYDVTIYPHGGAILANEFEIPGLFILDKQLAGVDGLDICTYLKQSNITSHVPVIMLSANPDIVKLAERAGANDVIEKPFSMKTLLATVAKHLNGTNSDTPVSDPKTI